MGSRPDLEGLFQDGLAVQRDLLGAMGQPMAARAKLSERLAGSELG